MSPNCSIEGDDDCPGHRFIAVLSDLDVAHCDSPYFNTVLLDSLCSTAVTVRS